MLLKKLASSQLAFSKLMGKVSLENKMHIQLTLSKPGYGKTVVVPNYPGNNWKL